MEEAAGSEQKRRISAKGDCQVSSEVRRDAAISCLARDR
jgi:hypothetical protein